MKRSKRRNYGGHGPKRVSLSPLRDADILASAEAKDLAADVIPGDLRKHWRVSSVRTYRRYADRIIHWFLLGKLGAKDAQLAMSVIKDAASLLMSEKLLHHRGIPDDEPEHPRGADGGGLVPEDAPAPLRVVRMEKTTGIGHDGNPVDTTMVGVEGGADLGAELPLLGLERTQEREPVPAPPAPPAPPSLLKPKPPAITHEVAVEYDSDA